LCYDALVAYRKENPNNWPAWKEEIKQITFWWSFIGPTFAFIIWGIAMPESPFTAGENAPLKPVWGLIALVVALVLSLIDKAIKP
jgi:hypothetical protein